MRFAYFLFIDTALNFDFSMKIYPSFIASSARSNVNACVYRGKSVELHNHKKGCENIQWLNTRRTIQN